MYKHEDRTIAKPRAIRIPLAYTLGPVLKAMVKKMTALAGMSHILTSRFLLTICCHLDSDISLWVNDDWEMKGPFAVAIEGDEPVEWDNNKEMELLMVSKFRLDLRKILTLSHSGTLNPRLWLPPPSFPLCHLCRRSLKWLELKNAGKWTGRDLSIDELRSLYIRKTNYNTYSKMFDNAEQFPILHALLNDPTYDQSSEEHRAVWGTRKLTKENLAAVTKELKDKEDKEKRAKEKARLAKEKKSKKASTSK